MKKLLLIAMCMLSVSSLLFASGASEEAAAEEGLNITIVTTPSGVDDGSFNEENYNGILSFIEKNPGATVTPLREPSGDVAKALKVAADVVADYDVEVCTGFQFSGISQLAIDNPDTKFILVDTFPADPADPFSNVELDNVYAMLFAEQESGFFAGVAAALESKTAKVAVINGVAYPSNVNYQWGFECGVLYANAKYGTDVEIVELPSQAGTDVTGANVGGNYVGSFADEATGKIVANQLIAKGCDILFVAAGGSGNGVFTAAKESNGSVKVIGCDVDQWDDGKAGDSNIILTSVLKVMGVNVDKQLQKINDGTFKGMNEVLNAQTDSTGFVKADGRQQLSADTVAKVDAAYKAVKAGEIVPAANFNGITPETFEIN